MPQAPSLSIGEVRSGAYIITSLATNRPIGRKHLDDRQFVEDLYMSNEPKPVRIVTLPEESQDIAWDLQELQNRKFILRSRGTPTHIVNGGVGATLVYASPPARWVLTPAFANSNEAFVITTEDGRGIWHVTGEEPGSPIDIRPLPPASSNGGTLAYQPNQMFKLTLLR